MPVQNWVAVINLNTLIRQNETKTKKDTILNPFSFLGILKMLFFSLARQIIQA